MRHTWLFKNNKDALLLFFSGWGVDHHPFTNLNESEYDVLFLDKYHAESENKLDITLFEGYKKIVVIGWSMGVVEAVQCFANISVIVDFAYAINGTCLPVNKQYGIDPYWFEKTLDRFDKNVIDQFCKRMCRSKELIEYYDNNSPQRSLVSLEEELKYLYKKSLILNENSTNSPFFSKAVVSKRDFVIPTRSQKNYWQEQGTEVSLYDGAHYIFSDFSSWSDLLETLEQL